MSRRANSTAGQRSRRAIRRIAAPPGPMALVADKAASNVEGQVGREGSVMLQTRPGIAVIRNALKVACRAPSIHNSQPWHWVLNGPELQLFVDRIRRVDIADQSGREAILSCGSVLDHLRVAMTSAGWKAQISRFPEPDNPDLLATIAFRPVEFVTEIQHKRAAAILERRTDRLPLCRPTLWTWFLPGLQKEVGDTAVMLDELSDEVRPQLASASHSTKIVRGNDATYQAELHWWTSSFALSDGIPPETLASASELRRIDIGRDFPTTSHSERRTGVALDWSRILVLSTSGDTRVDVLRCGEALSRVLLECTMAGMATCTLTHLIELEESRNIVRRLIGQRGEPQVLIRVGIAPPMEVLPAATPRLPLDAVLQIAESEVLCSKDNCR